MIDNGLKGTLATISAYALWGVLPIYWKIMDALPAMAILSFRIVFALVFVTLLLIFRRQLREVRSIFSDARKILMCVAAAVLITANWGIYIGAVNADRILETSFGYYINPLISIFLGMIFLREKLNRLQVFALGLAVAAVVIIGVEYGRLPWIALALALTFGVYGLIKKTIGLSAVVSLGLETLFATPIAIVLFAFLAGSANPGVIGPMGWILAVLTGPITAIPLMLFGYGVGRIPLYAVGFMQYLSPTIGLILGIFVYHEAFGTAQLFGFGLVWAALVVFSIDQLKRRIGGAQAKPGPEQHALAQPEGE